MEKSNYASLVTHAEQAVQSVKDPELRKVAFEKVLDRNVSTGLRQLRYEISVAR